MSGPVRRPHRSNPPTFERRKASIDQVLRQRPAEKRIYWTDRRLKIFALPYISARKVHYRRAMDHIHKLLADGQIIESKPGLPRPLEMLQEYDRRAPHRNEIDPDRLREVFETLDERTSERLAAIILAERDRMDLQGERVIPRIRQKEPFGVKQWPAKFGKNEPRFAPHIPMTKETRELAKEIRRAGTIAIIIDCQDEGKLVRISRDEEPEVLTDMRRRKLWRRHVIKPKRKK